MTDITHLAAHKLGFDGYARMLALTLKPRTTREIVELTGVSPYTINPSLSYCVRAGVVGVDEWVRPAHRSRLVPRWRFGAEVKPNPDGREMSKQKPRSPLVLLVALLEATRSEPMTVTELARDVGYSISITQVRVRALHSAGLVHVAEWDRPKLKGTSVARYSFGPGIDRPRPPRQSKEAKALWLKQYKARQRTAALLGLRAA